MLGDFKAQDSIIKTYSGAYQIRPNIQSILTVNKRISNRILTNRGRVYRKFSRASWAIMVGLYLMISNRTFLSINFSCQFWNVEKIYKYFLNLICCVIQVMFVFLPCFFWGCVFWWLVVLVVSHSLTPYMRKKRMNSLYAPSSNCWEFKRALLYLSPLFISHPDWSIIDCLIIPGTKRHKEDWYVRWNLIIQKGNAAYFKQLI